MRTCIPSHRLKRSQHSCHRMGECRQQQHTQHAPSTKTKCDYLNGWSEKNSHIRKNLTQNGEPQKLSWEHRKRRRRSPVQDSQTCSSSGGRLVNQTCFPLCRVHTGHEKLEKSWNSKLNISTPGKNHRNFYLLTEVVEKS